MLSPREAREIKARLSQGERTLQQRPEPLSIEEQAETLELFDDGAIVRSSSRLDLVHHVHVNPKTNRLECTCEDFLFHTPKPGYMCRHIHAFAIRKQLEEVQAADCSWCELVLSGYPEPYLNGYFYIPRPSRSHCERHKAIQKKLKRGFYHAPPEKDMRPLFEECYREGLEVTQERRVA